MMIIKSFGVALALGLMVTAPVAVQAADGLTPAEETVCSPLQADGVTKGLYGLCVAFCEARDFADVGTPLPDNARSDLVDGASSGRILDDYNRKLASAQNPNDPSMPCVDVESACPCWTAAELAAIDGLHDAGLYDVGIHLGSITPVPAHTIDNVDHYESDGGARYTVLARTFLNLTARNGAPDLACTYQRSVQFPLEIVNRLLSVSKGTLTPAEWDVCDSMLRDSITADGH